MYSNGPIILADAAANYFTLAHYICGRHCQFTQMGAAADGFNLAYYFLGGTANALRWAHCIGDAAADYFTWAHKISVRHCQCIRMEDPNQGTLHLVPQQCFPCVSTVLLY